MATHSIASKQRSLEILDEVCREGATVRVISPTTGRINFGKLSAVAPHLMQIRLDEDAAPTTSIQDDELCCLIFNFQNRPHVLLSAVLEVSEGSRPTVSLAIPEDIAAAERRHVDRVEL